MGAQTVSPGNALLMNLMPIIIIFLVFYFLSIKPNLKKQKEHQKMLDNLKKGDKVVTSGGIYGTIVEVQQNIFKIKIAENTNIQILKSAILTLVQDENISGLK